MEEMKWFGSTTVGVLAANNLGFGLALAGICLPFGKQQCQGDHGTSQISHTDPEIRKVRFNTEIESELGCQS
jgi:hypothetical protein